MQADTLLTRDLVLIGGGHTHALVLRQWGMKPLPGVRLTLINPAATTPYTGMLPGHVAGHYSERDLDIDLFRLARFAGARLVIDSAAGIETGAQRVALQHGSSIRFDVASVDIGVTSDLPALEGFDPFGHAAKPLGRFAAAWSGFLDRAVGDPGGATCAVIGGGVAGVELALAMAHHLRRRHVSPATVTLIEAGPRLLNGVATGTRQALRRALENLHVPVIVGATPARVDPSGVMLADGRRIAAGFVVSAAGARPHAWLAGTGLALTNGFITVGPTLQAVDAPHLFAVGDCAHLAHAPRPKAGVFAVRQAPVLFANLQATLTGGRLRTYHPQRDYLKLISAGGQTAVAEKFGLTVSGPSLWALKHRIDRRFMDHLTQLPQMTQAGSVGAAGEAMFCGGCGSKVARDGLAAALQPGTAPTRADVLRGPGDDAAILEIGGQRQVITTDHLRAFTLDHAVLARIAAIHALGDVWAMGAAPQSALLSVIIPRMSEPLQTGTVAEIVAAVRAVLAAAGADLVGGHTSMGAELSIGLTATGLLTGPAIGLGGAQAGDALILTKPIGTGVVLAAEMRGLADGRDYAAALRSMTHPLGAASALLAPVAHAMTDVTGFGLAGHLMNILEASSVGAQLDLAAIPCLPGAEALSARGVRSTLWEGNAQLRDRVTRPASPASDLLFDPQTAGGLLAAVPAHAADACLAALHAAGEPAALIGYLAAGVPAIRVS